MLVFGLTGGIGSGKTTVSVVLEELGCAVIDTDVLARRVVEPGKPAWRKIVNHFGQEILREDGCINRERLGSIVFGDDSKRKLLNSCTHPHIRREVLWELIKHFIKGRSHVVLVSPLLFETNHALRYLHQTVVVTCTSEQQLSRLMARDKLTKEDALKRIGAQMPLASKRLLADREIDNSGDVLATRRLVERLAEDMQRLSHFRRLLYRGFILVLATVMFVFILYLSFT